jgi:hypothetical protein
MNRPKQTNKPKRWKVEHAGDSETLQGKLNELSRAGWNILQIIIESQPYVDRANMFSIVAWQ